MTPATSDLIQRLRLQPEDIGGPSRMDMLRERKEAADALSQMVEQMERAALACAHGESELARRILLDALGTN
jgi:hypothetical protein